MGEQGAVPGASGDRAIELRGIRKTYGTVEAVGDISLQIATGEFFTLLGPSGSGKTTTLRIIAGFELPDRGTVLIQDRDVTRAAPYDRPVNTVFQDYALFPHLNVLDNVAYGLRVKGVGKDERRSRAEEALAMVRLPDIGARRPVALSGGQRQRVALARALVNRPAVLLLDEPLGALDLKLRQQMQIELKAIQRELSEQITFVYVTHDQDEALSMSDRIAVFSAGRIEQIGTPGEVYEKPTNEFVAGFVGTSNPYERDGKRWTIRPERIRLLPADSSAGEPGTVTEVSYLGAQTRYDVTLDGGDRMVVVEQNTDISASEARERKGSRVRLAWNEYDATALEGEAPVPASDTAALENEPQEAQQ